MLKVVSKRLKDFYDVVYETDEYVYAVGDIPIALIAHCDTVFKNNPQILFNDPEYGVYFYPGGSGFDDRAGVFAIFKILSCGYRPSIIFTNHEEIGGTGAKKLVLDFPEPEAELDFLIELDRAGSDDCVFYQCDNPEFVKYIESFGFKFNRGSFTDISFIAPVWGMAAVNLSIGYEYEHTDLEILFIEDTYATIRKVCNILEDNNHWKFYQYIPEARYYMGDSLFGFGKEVQCCCCGEIVNELDSVPIKQQDGTVDYYCVSCCEQHIDWCYMCGEPYIAVDGAVVCPECERKTKEGK